jgi:hypothetical protein
LADQRQTALALPFVGIREVIRFVDLDVDEFGPGTFDTGAQFIEV